MASIDPQRVNDLITDMLLTMVVSQELREIGEKMAVHGISFRELWRFHE